VQLEEKYHYVMKGNAGTAGYLAPEVWAGESYGISPDVWSFGVSGRRARGEREQFTLRTGYG
jgi:serine/threonine protein kinase